MKSHDLTPADDLSPSPREERTEGVVYADELNMRSAPRVSATCVGCLPEGTRIRIHEIEDGWCRITPVGDVTGFVRREAVEGQRLATAAALMASPSPHGDHLGWLPAGWPLRLLEGDAAWCHVQVPSHEELRCFVNRSYVRMDSDGSLPLQLTADNWASSLPQTLGLAVFDCRRRRMLQSQNAETPVPIASLTKMMTLLVALEAMEADASLSWDTRVPISQRAANEEPTIAGLMAGDTIALRELLPVMICVSANDCATCTAEFFGGTVEAFVEKMNRKAAAMGLAHTCFHNAHGLSERTAAEDNVSTPSDLVTLTTALLEKPLARAWVSSTQVTCTTGVAEPITFHGHVPFLGRFGVDGVKTGYTQRAGCCVASHLKHGDDAYIIIITGCESNSYRDTLLRAIIKSQISKSTEH